MLTFSLVQKTKSILLIDDDDSILMALGLFLDESHTCHKTTDGQDGVAMCMALNPDLVVTDLSMPNMDGMQVIQAIREMKPATPILAMSGMRMSGSMLAVAKKLGASAILFKPFSKSEFTTAVDNLLSEKQKGAAAAGP